MGLFKTSEEKKASADERDAKYIANHPELYRHKEKVKMQAEYGISSVADPKDYSKIIIEQNETIINMLTTIAISGGALASASALMNQGLYNKKIKNILYKQE